MPEDRFSSYNPLDVLAQAAAELNDYPTIHHHNEFMGVRASSVDSLPEVTELVHSTQNYHTSSTLEIPDSQGADILEIHFVAYDHSASDIPSPGQIPSPVSKRRPGCPRTKSIAQKNINTMHTSNFPIEPSPEPVVPTFSMWLLILQKEKVIKTRGGKPSKTEKVPPKMFGPVDIPVDSSYQQFLEIIRAGIKGIQYSKHWKGNQEKVVYLEMAPPLQVQQQDKHLPWESNTTITGHHKSSVLVLNQAGGDEDPPATEDEGPMAKKAKLDDDIEAIIAEIQERYSSGKACQEPAHALISCFVHRSTGQHFDVGFRARAIFWARKIRSEHSKATPKIAKSTASTVSLMEAPSTPTVPQAAAAAPVPPADQPQSLVQQLAAAQQLMIHAADVPSPWEPFTFTIYTPKVPTKSPSRSSSPPMTDNRLTLQDFCDANRFNSAIEERLKKLEFQPGNNLAFVKESDWKLVGFQLLSWNHVRKANKKYWISLKENSDL
ncbi:hypothetical protein C8R42DRAFT_722024 [Lentinula raphanica]|nr:hypothetical protein C8R42DRAFT_722024 [Lentinula raphanica]